jgi:hypothetical protein
MSGMPDAAGFPTREEIVALAQSVLEYKPVNPPSFVDAARVLSQHVMREEARKLLADDALALAVKRANALKGAIEAIAAALPEDRNAVIGQAISLARASLAP